MERDRAGKKHGKEKKANFDLPVSICARCTLRDQLMHLDGVPHTHTNKQTRIHINIFFSSSFNVSLIFLVVLLRGLIFILASHSFLYSPLLCFFPTHSICYMMFCMSYYIFFFSCVRM